MYSIIKKIRCISIQINFSRKSDVASALPPACGGDRRGHKEERCCREEKDKRKSGSGNFADPKTKRDASSAEERRGTGVRLRSTSGSFTLSASGSSAKSAIVKFTKGERIDVERHTEESAYRLKTSQKIYCGFKTVADFVIALVALIILSPIFLGTAIAIKIDSKGPVFFVQKRVGKNGKEFNCIKFRSMSVDARHDVAGYEYAEVNSYITRVGKVIRKLSIDELPQLFCMLTGKMSLIGYRPSQANEHELNEAREMYGVHQIKPGISGWAQVNGRDVLAAQPKKKAAFDAYYLRHVSLWLDIKIFFMTVVKVFKGDGVEEGVLTEENTDSETEKEGVGQDIAEQEVAFADSHEFSKDDTPEGRKKEELLLPPNGKRNGEYHDLFA